MAIASSIGVQASYCNEYHLVRANEMDLQDLSGLCREVDGRASLTTAAKDFHARQDAPAAPTTSRLESLDQVNGFLLVTFHKPKRTIGGLSGPGAPWWPGTTRAAK
jgi:hypothetical protein